MRLVIILSFVLTIFSSCKSKSFTVQLIPAAEEIKKTPDGLEIYNKNKILILFKTIELYPILEKEMNKKDINSESKNRIPDFTYVQYKIKNNSDKDIYFSFMDSFFSQKSITTNKVVNKKEYDEIFTSRAYHLIEYEKMFAVYDKKFKNEDKKKICSSKAPCMIKSGQTLWQIIPYSLIIPHSRKVVLIFKEPYEFIPMMPIQKKDVQIEFYLKNNR